MFLIASAPVPEYIHSHLPLWSSDLNVYEATLVCKPEKRPWTLLSTLPPASSPYRQPHSDNLENKLLRTYSNHSRAKSSTSDLRKTLSSAFSTIIVFSTIEHLALVTLIKT
ncbi:hypothetical protein PGT21_026239 [Puccinia graminis f. sp. tritici]|uniref:Uncharacterized protein n=1 Tax=Puccinia graminis f. sp. tritici TaxID=56615 RepID=A0A5B0LSG5_PUCGR|nr:hypothetical protein PGTUg99_028263 [Puccinia graminis f. sp. tritici]KAA1072026.1 hypothetical protein PGT21_026239 [Puccinia graminis f. sp. tritici]